MRKGKRCSHSIALAGLALGSNCPEILVSYQETFLERSRAGPGKRSRTRHQHVGKMLCALSWLRAVSGIWSMSHPTSPLPSSQAGEGLPGRHGCVVDARLATESLSWRSEPRLQAETLQPLPRAGAKQYEQIILSWASIFPSSRKILWRTEMKGYTSTAVWADTTSSPFRLCFATTTKNVVMQAFFMVFFFFS